MLKRKNIVKILGIGGLCLFLLGCSEESFLLQEEEASTLILEEEMTANQEEVVTQNDESIVAAESQETAVKIAVHICGAVKQPGVYYLEENQRVYEGIQKAGGFQEEADQDYLNQAMILEDGMKIIVPTKEETEQIRSREANEKETDFVQNADMSGTEVKSEGFIQAADSSEMNEAQNGKIDLNTADEALLCTLPGIGESRAKSIIAYREENGPFQNPEDIMKVSGIKEAAYEKIRNYVTVSR